MPFTDCITEIYNTQLENERDPDVVTPMYNLIEYSDHCSRTSGSLLQYFWDVPKNNITESKSFEFKSKFLNDTENVGIIDAKIAVLLK